SIIIMDPKTQNVKGVMKMRFIRRLVLVIILIGIIYYIYDTNDFTMDETHEVKEHQKSIREPEKREFEQPSSVLKGDIYGWMGQDSSILKDAFGEPVRKDKSRYGYTWWI